MMVLSPTKAWSRITSYNVCYTKLLRERCGFKEGDGNYEKYVFQSLYDNSQVEAEKDASKNKYKLKGRYKSIV